MKTLCFIPYHSAKEYALKHVTDWVKNAQLPDCEVIMRWHTGPFGEKDAVKTQREFARRLAQGIGAQKLFFVGADTIPPLDALPRLLALNLPLVSGTYKGRFEGANTVRGMDCALIDKEVFDKISWFDWEMPDDDLPFYDAAAKLGYEVYFDPTVVCRHYEDEDLFF